MENVTPPYPPNPELRRPHPGQPLPPARPRTALPAAGLAWLGAGLVMGLAAFVLQYVAIHSSSGFGWNEWPLLISQFLVFAGGIVGGVGAVAIGVRIALPAERA